MDAMGTQRDIARKTIGKNGDHVPALKPNHPNLHDGVKLFFDTYIDAPDGGGFNIMYVSKKEKGHGGIEHRRYYITDRIGWLHNRGAWEGLYAGRFRRRGGPAIFTCTESSGNPNIKEVSNESILQV